MAAAADPSLWRDDNLDTPPVQWEAVASDQRWWWTFVAPDPVTYIGARPLPAILEFDWEITDPPDVPGTLFFVWSLAGVGGASVPLGNTVGSGTIQIPTAGYTPGGTLSFHVESQFGSGAYEGAVAVLGPDIPEASSSTFNIELSWSAASQGTHPITAYRLYRSVDGAAYALLAEISVTEERAYVDEGIAESVVYAYRVTSVDVEGNESVASNVVSLERV